MSASMMGREYGGCERRFETVDLPVAIEPVRPIRSMGGGSWRGSGVAGLTTTFKRECPPLLDSKEHNAEYC